MNRSSFALAALLCVALPASAAGVWAQDHHLHETAAPSAVAAPVPAQRYTPDAPLRAGMRSVHKAVDELRHAEAGHLSAAMTKDRAVTIETAIAGMFANCKLTAEPDAALHGILIPLLSAAQTLKADPSSTAPVAVMRSAIAAYPRYFADPGWDQPAAGNP